MIRSDDQIASENIRPVQHLNLTLAQIGTTTRCDDGDLRWTSVEVDRDLQIWLRLVAFFSRLEILDVPVIFLKCLDHLGVFENNGEVPVTLSVERSLLACEVLKYNPSIVQDDVTLIAITSRRWHPVLLSISYVSDSRHLDLGFVVYIQNDHILFLVERQPHKYR